MFGNRGIYHKGWTAVTRHKTPWLLVGEQAPAFDDDVWELYDTNVRLDAVRRRLGAASRQLHELQRLFLIEATQHNVLPLDDRVAERLIPELAGRPMLVKGNRQRLFGGMGRLTESSIVSIKNKSHAVTAEIVVPDGGAQGVIIAQGGSIGGWSLYVKDGRLRYCYNLLGVQRFYVDSDRELPAGTHQVRMEFDYDGPGLGKGGTATLYLDGDAGRRGRRRRDRGDDLLGRRHVRRRQARTARSWPRTTRSPNAFTGEVNWVEIDVDEAADDADHRARPGRAAARRDGAAVAPSLLRRRASSVLGAPDLHVEPR